MNQTLIESALEVKTLAIFPRKSSITFRRVPSARNRLGLVWRHRRKMLHWDNSSHSSSGWNTESSVSEVGASYEDLLVVVVQLANLGCDLSNLPSLQTVLPENYGKMKLLLHPLSSLLKVKLLKLSWRYNLLNDFHPPDGFIQHTTSLIKIILPPIKYGSMLLLELP